MRKQGPRITAKTIVMLLVGLGVLLLLVMYSFSEWSPRVNLAGPVNPAFTETRPALAYAMLSIPIPVHTGQEVFEVAAFPASLKEAYPQMAKWKLGYMCDRLGILFADVWTWNCKLVAYDDRSRTYTDLPEDIRLQLELEYPMSKAQRGFWNHYGIVVLVVVVMFLGALKSGRQRMT